MKMSARHLRKSHLALALVWGTLGLAVTLIWLYESILWVGIMSVYAIVVAHLAAYDAARAEEQGES